MEYVWEADTLAGLAVELRCQQDASVAQRNRRMRYLHGHPALGHQL